MRHHGVVLVAVFALLTAAKEVLAGNLVQSADPSVVVLAAFVLTAGVFHLANAADRSRRPVARAELADLAVVNLASAGAWGILFYALQYVEPAVVSAIIAAVGPLLTILLHHLMRSGEPVLASDIWTGLGILIAILFLIRSSGEGPAINVAATPLAVWSSLFACVASGAAVVATTVYSKRLYVAGWTPRRLMAHRFYLLILLAAADLWLRAVDPAAELAMHWPRVLLIALGGIAFPIYILQFGIRASSPVQVAVVIALTPVFILGFQLFDARLGFNLASFAGVVLVSGCVIANIYLRRHLHAS